MAKISVAWLGVIALIAVVAFFSYQIASVAAQDTKKQVRFEEVHSEQVIRMAVPAPMVAPATATRTTAAAGAAATADAAPVVQKAPVNSLPQVPGQTAEDLKMDEPLRATPPAIQYDPPGATDPLNRVAFQDAEFGSNLRHPEQMMERRPKPQMPSTATGIASERSSPGGNNAQGYSREMVQNGGDFMGAVLAFDGSEVGTAYSLF
jgi:hypothetical protein